MDAAGLRLARLAVLLGVAVLLWSGMLAGTDAVAGDAADVVGPDVELFVPPDGSRTASPTAS